MTVSLADRYANLFAVEKSERTPIYDSIIDQASSDPRELTDLFECLELSNQIQSNHPGWQIPNSLEFTTRIIERLVSLEEADYKTNPSSPTSQEEMQLIDLMDSLILHGFFTRKNCENYPCSSKFESRVIRQLTLGINSKENLDEAAEKNITTVHKIIEIRAHA